MAATASRLGLGQAGKEREKEIEREEEKEREGETLSERAIRVADCDSIVNV